MNDRPTGFLAFMGGVAALVLMSAGATPLFVSFFALFLDPVSRDLHWDPARFPQGLLAYSISYAVAAPLAGGLSDRVGLRLSVLPGIALTTAGLFGISAMSGSFAELILYSCIIGLGGALVSPPTLVRSIAYLFRSRRGLAIGVIFGSGPMLLAAVFSPLISGVIAAAGWRSAYREIATIAAVASFVMAIAFLGNTNAREDMPPGAAPGGLADGLTLREAVRTRTFWMLLATAFLMAVTFGGVSGHIVAIAREHGLSARMGAGMLSAIFLGGVVAPITAGAATDRFQSAKALIPFLIASLIGFVLLIGNVGVSLSLVASVLIGLGFGAWSGQLALLITRYFGLLATGAIAGVVFSVGGVSLGAGPVAVGLVRTTTGDYRVALICGAVMQVLAVLLIASTRGGAERTAWEEDYANQAT